MTKQSVDKRRFTRSWSTSNPDQLILKRILKMIKFKCVCEDWEFFTFGICSSSSLNVKVGFIPTPIISECFCGCSHSNVAFVIEIFSSFPGLLLDGFGGDKVMEFYRKIFWFTRLNLFLLYSHDYFNFFQYNFSLKYCIKGFAPLCHQELNIKCVE